MPIVLELFAHHLPLSETWLAFSDMLASEESRLEPYRPRADDPARGLAYRIGLRWSRARIGRELGLAEAQLAALPQGASAAVW